MFKSVKYFIRNFFGFSRSEANGFLVLLVLMSVLIIGLPIYSRLAFHTTYSNADEDKLVLDSLAKILDAGVERKEDPSKLEEVELFPFDPNSADLPTLKRLGLEEQLARRIINYREAGGAFRQKNDLKKIYGLTDDTFDRLSPFITLPNELVSSSETGKRKSAEISGKDKRDEKKVKTKTKLAFDLNEADTAQLKKVYGIGDVLSLRITKYRDLIGGFIHESQLREVYGLDEDVIKQLSDAGFIVPEFLPKQIDINSANIETLAKHPYISWSIARAIYAYRQQHGQFEHINVLQSIHLTDSAKLVQLKPYIRL